MFLSQSVRLLQHVKFVDTNWSVLLRRENYMPGCLGNRSIGSVASCKDTWCTEAAKRLSFHRVPKDDRLVKAWISRCCRKDSFNAKTSVICSEHFEAGKFVIDLIKEFLSDAVKARPI